MQPPPEYPLLRLSHLRTLTNNSGIIQHGWFSMPNEQTGYCTDDNCRAFLVAVQAYQRLPDPELLRLIGIYLSFLRAAHNDKGTFRNFMSYQQFFLDEEGSEDCLGRTLWALGYAMRKPPHERVAAVCRDLFEPAFTWLPKLDSTRGWAYSLLGLRNYHLARPDDRRAVEMTRLLASNLAEKWRGYATEKWPWFAGRLTYANGVPPMALLLASEVTGDKQFAEIGLRALDWLTTILVRDDVMVPIGCSGWYQKSRKRNDWDQQGIDPAGMVGAYLTAFRMTGDKGYCELATIAYNWFHGGNLLGVDLVDPVTGGCCDGLTETGPNANEGAESSLVYYLATMALLRDAPVSL
jgi:hypothetical protein